MRKSKKNYIKNSSGITLIALVITIIVLLILAGVSLSLIMGNDGILGRAENAVTEHTNASIEEEVELALAELKMEYYDAYYVKGTTTKLYEAYLTDKLSSADGMPTSKGTITLEGENIFYTSDKTGKMKAGTLKEATGDVSVNVESAGGSGNTVTIPVGLEVGSVVSYTPSGTYIEWTSAHSGNSSYNYTLASGNSYTDSTTQTDMTISSWKVFKIDEATGEVKLVPNEETAKVGLKGADGYNNAVKLLNDACESLYSNTAKGIKARSIKLEDIEDEEVLDYDPKTYYNDYASYGEQKAEAYTIANSKYPAIYAEETDSVINGKNAEERRNI